MTGTRVMLRGFGAGRGVYSMEWLFLWGSVLCDNC